MADQGLMIAKKNRDVGGAERYLIMSTKYPVLKLKASGTGTASMTASSGGFTVTIAHNLGYAPICFVYGEYFDLTSEQVVSRYKRWNRYIYQGLQVADLYYYYVDTTNLYIVFSACYLTDAFSFDLDYMYHIFYDEDALV
jgi:hypothetical protein